MKPLILFFVLTFVFAANAFGQETTASMQGAVSDVNQAFVSGAKITATNQATGFVRTAISDESGNYALPLLPVGRYDLAVEAANFQRFVQRNIVLVLNQDARVNVQLTAGAVSETVEVNAEASLINLEQGALGQVIGRRRIDELPLNGRNFLRLATLQAG
ncbi:MAG: carboxypeptidase-like regulatory domain-containing protein, partial [Acidobacteriota bacterium]|nr:carboxypeptidase-like regulatory domain-containing protein [Acidobacteriota bacterium]